MSWPHGLPFIPTGPGATIIYASTPMAAAMNLLPGAALTGNPPLIPTNPSTPGRIY
ncbi:hypothetical protein [Rhodococcoides fascians]|uniref:hypothetical protein n=1 Tax=Rhodococcoides fascians TaxID=1828 RepID=UPI000AB641F0|nr:hypothetical protein [Rhodococcus fascians]